jgi:alcohol dehydrogenase class IV
MDTAKLAALLAMNGGQIHDWLGVVAPPQPVVPIALVPTTTGTGSEATRIAMLTIEGRKRIVSCAQFLPIVAALDPELVADLPGAVVASTGMDALAHALESMLSENRTFLTVALGTRAVELLLEHLESAVLRRDAVARGHLLYAAYLAGMSLNAGVVVGHSLGYVIARRARLPHGTACGLVLPYCLAYDQAVDRLVAEHIARLMTRGTSAELRAAAVAIDHLLRRLGFAESLAAVSIDLADLDAVAAEAVLEYPRPNNPEPLVNVRLRSLLEYMHRGDLLGAWAAMAKPVCDS